MGTDVAALLRSFCLIHPREVWQQLEPRIRQVLLVLDQPLELFQPLQNAVEVCRFRPRSRSAQGAHNSLLVIRLLIFQIDLRIEGAGKVGRQVAWILRPDGDARSECTAFAREAFKMGAGGNAPGLVDDKQPRQLPGLRPPQKHAMQPDDDQARRAPP